VEIAENGQNSRIFALGAKRTLFFSLLTVE
jgi:hypothetical protein